MVNRTWIVRAGKDAVYIDDFRSNALVAIGWHETGPIAATANDEAVTALFDRTFPASKRAGRRVWQAQVMRFLREIQPGDAVGTYDPNTRLYLLGNIVGQPEWREGLMPRVRRP